METWRLTAGTPTADRRQQEKGRTPLQHSHRTSPLSACLDGTGCPKVHAYRDERKAPPSSHKWLGEGVSLGCT